MESWLLLSQDVFRDVLEANTITSGFASGVLAALVVLAGFNNLALSALVFMNKRRKHVYMWVGLWFGLIAVFKIMNMLW